MTFAENKSRQLDEAVSRMDNALLAKLASCESDLRETASRLAALNPLAVLARGYSVTYRNDVPVRSAGEIAPGDLISVRFNDGRADCRVEKTTTEDTVQ